MKKPRKVLIATKDEGFRILDLGPAGQAGIEIEYAPQRALGALNGKALDLSALVVEIDARDPAAVREFEALAGATPQRKLIAAAPDADSADVRRLFRAGAADVLTAPLSPEGLVTTLLDILAAEPPAAVEQGKVVAVLKASGGAGATTLALNTARLLCAGTERKGAPRRAVAVLDLDLQFGDTDLALNLEPRSSVLDIIRAQGRFDGRFLQSVLTEHESGIRLLAPSPSLLPLDAMSPAFAVELAEASARAHQLTMIDLPSTWTDWTLAVLRRADLIVLAAPATVSGVAGARRLLDALRDDGVTTPLLFVVSRLSGMLDALDKPARIGRTLGVDIDATLAFDPQAVRAADRGKLLVDAFPNTRLAKELRGLAAKMDQKLAAAAPAASALAGARP